MSPALDWCEGIWASSVMSNTGIVLQVPWLLLQLSAIQRLSEFYLLKR